MTEYKTTREQLENMVGVLAHTRLRPQMYTGSANIDAVRGFLSGFYFAFSFMGFTIHETENQIARERGWIISSGGLIAVMTERGLTDKEMSVELFTILILALVHQYDLSPKLILKEHARMQEFIKDEYELEIMSKLEKDLGI